MIKVIPPDSWDFGEEIFKQIKVSSFGLRGNDLTNFIKRAGHELADFVKKIQFEPGDYAVHALAMGAHSKFGVNRNADTWYEDDLKKDHHTFEKLARIYRQHVNKNPEKSYGIIKKSYYNPEMYRVELIAILNSNKSAADRNGGQIAEREINDIESGKEIGGSMSTRISHDLSLCCNNRATKRSQYCDEFTCKYGGMKKNAGKVCEDGKQVAVSNHGNKFFDYSLVRRPADRTAYFLGKVASADDRVIPGSELAEILGITAPAELLYDEENPCSADMLGRIKIARDMAALEKSLLDSPWSLAFLPEVRYVHDLDKVPSYERANVLSALTQEKVALDITEWLQLITGESQEKCANVAHKIETMLPAIHQSLVDDDQMIEIMQQSIIPETTSNRWRKWAAEKADHASVEKGKMEKRLMHAVLKKLDQKPEVKVKVKVKTAADISGTAKQLATRYAAYQVEFLHNFEKNSDFPLTRELLIHQNRVRS